MRQAHLAHEEAIAACSKRAQKAKEQVVTARYIGTAGPSSLTSREISFGYLNS